MWLAFQRQAGYFDVSAEANPFLHTWSLGVEEQFYILFPLFFWLATKWAGRRAALVFAIATTLGAAASVGVAD